MEFMCLDVIYDEWLIRHNDKKRSPHESVWIETDLIREHMGLKKGDNLDEKKFFKLISELVLKGYIALNCDTPFEELEMANCIPNYVTVRLTTKGRLFYEEAMKK